MVASVSSEWSRSALRATRCWEAVDDYFARWQVALAQLLQRSGLSKSQAQRRAEDALLTIQGALVLARARNDAEIFRRALSGTDGAAAGAGGVTLEFEASVRGRGSWRFVGALAP